MWKPRPSATSARPIISRNDSASIRVVGCRSMNAGDWTRGEVHDRDREDNRGDHHADMSAMPIAVRIESTENTMSITAIWLTMAPKLA